MAKLPRSLIKKYGISKKAWSVFRSSQSRGRKTAKVTTVARRRRFGRARAGVRRGFRKFRRASRSQGAIDLYTIGGAMAYGAFRGDIDNAVTPKVAQYLPSSMAPYASNIVLGGLAYLGAKKTSGIIQKVSKAALLIEAANAGAKLRGGMSSGGNSQVALTSAGGYTW